MPGFIQANAFTNPKSSTEVQSGLYFTCDDHTRLKGVENQVYHALTTFQGLSSQQIRQVDECRFAFCASDRPGIFCKEDQVHVQ